MTATHPDSVIARSPCKYGYHTLRPTIGRLICTTCKVRIPAEPAVIASFQVLTHRIENLEKTVYDMVGELDFLVCVCGKAWRGLSPDGLYLGGEPVCVQCFPEKFAAMAEDEDDDGMTEGVTEQAAQWAAKVPAVLHLLPDYVRQRVMEIRAAV